MLYWLVSWSSVIGEGKCLWSLRFIWCHSQVFQSSASWCFQSPHIKGLEIAESTSPDERCLKGGYQDWGTQSKHLTHMHTLALRVFGSDENWQWFVCNDYSCVCDPQLVGQPSSQTSNIWITERVLSLSKSRLGGHGTVTNTQAYKLLKCCVCKLLVVSEMEKLSGTNDIS